MRELEAFHESAVHGAPVRNTVEQAMRDARLLTAVARAAVGGAA